MSILLLFGMTLVAFFGNRIYIFEQKTSANQLRATKAFEAAEAGVEWALGHLNDVLVLDASPSCTAATTNFLGKTSFRDRYAAPTGASGATLAGFYPIANSMAGCSMSSSGTLTCTCPTAGTVPTIGGSTDARFRVQFNPLAGDPLAFELVSTGCTSSDSACDGGSTVADATAVVRVLLKVVPTFGNASSSALTSGAGSNISGALTVVNTDPGTNGITINAGGPVAAGSGTTVVTVPGTPGAASILDNDPSLSALTTADGTGDLFFQSYFGKTMDAYQKDPLTKVINAADCGSAAACGALVSSWYDKGFQQFFIYPNVSFSNANLPLVGTLGTAAKPIFLAAKQDLELKSNLTAYGMLYGATATATELYDYSGSGAGTLFGSLVSRGAFNKGTGTLNIVYDPKIFGLGAGAPSGILVKVPGSWRDKSLAY